MPKLAKSKAIELHKDLVSAYEAYQSAVQDALEAITEVRDEFQEKYDELENPDGTRGEKLQEKIDELSFVDDIDPESPGADDFTTLDQYLYGITNPNLS